MTLFWLFQSVGYFWVINYPIHYQLFKTSKKLRTIHLISVVISLSLSTIPPVIISSTSCCRRTMLKAKLKTIAYKELGIFLKDDVLKSLTKSRCQSYWVIISTAGSIFSTLWNRHQNTITKALCHIAMSQNSSKKSRNKIRYNWGSLRCSEERPEALDLRAAIHH